MSNHAKEPLGRYSNAEVSDRFWFTTSDPADAVVLHEALMFYRNRKCIMPADFLRAEVADRLLSRLDQAVWKLAERRINEETSPAPTDGVS